MDYFLDIFELVHNPRMGLDTQEGLINELSVMPYAARHIGPEVALGLHELLKKACFEIRSVTLIDLTGDEGFDGQEQALHSLREVLIRHTSIVLRYIQAHVARHVSELDKGMEVIKLEIEPTDKPSDSEYTSIDG
jgi:hypothetical protein